MSLSVKKSASSVKNVLQSVTSSSNKFLKNDSATYLGIFLIFVLTIGYYINKHYNAIIFLYLITAVSYLLTKNLLISLIISIILTNFLISVNFFMDRNSITLKEGNRNEETQANDDLIEENKKKIRELNKKLKKNK